MITVSLALFAMFGAKAEDEVRFVGVTDGPRPTAGQCRDLDNDNWPSPFNKASAWSDNQIPHRGPVYIAGKTNGASSVLWTPISKDKPVNYDMFQTLILETGCTLCIRHSGGKMATFEDLRISGEPYIYGPSGTMALGGKITLENGSRLNVSTYNNKIVQVHSEVVGSGNLRFLCQTGTKSYGGDYFLYGRNENWFGTAEVTCRVDTPTLTTKYSRLSITNAISLGGALGEFTYNALTLMKLSSLVVEGKDVVLPATSNRGILIGTNGGRINVTKEAGTFTMNTSLTLSKNIHFYKEGPGRLILGSPLRFLNKNNTYLEEDVGTEVSYYIDIREGAISVTDCNALNGANLAFSNNTEMVMWADTTSNDIKNYGIRCDKTRYDTPLHTDMPIRLCMEDADNFKGGSYKIPLITVKKEYAEDVAGKLMVTVDIKGYKLGGISSEDSVLSSNTPTTTFYADVLHNGLVISVR